MYSSFPKKDRIAIRAALGSSWGFSALSGFAGVFFTPQTVTSELGFHLPVISSAVVLMFSFAALFGVVFNRYQFEWMASWFTAGGAFVYIVTVWGLVFTGSITRLQQAASLTALLGFYIYRIISCSAHARKQRTIHNLVQSGEVMVPDAK